MIYIFKSSDDGNFNGTTCIDEDLNVIKTNLATRNSKNKGNKHDDKWTYDGIMIPISQKLYFIFEGKYDDSDDPRDLVFIITTNKPKDHLPGVLTAESAKPSKAEYESFPSSTRILLQRINEDEIKKGEDYLISKMGYFQPDEIDQEYLFSWDEITGNDSGKLIYFLKSNYDVDWVKTPKITKTNNNKTITITAGKKAISMNLNNENTELNLIIDKVKTDNFIVKTENGKINIYDQEILKKINNNIKDKLGVLITHKQKCCGI